MANYSVSRWKAAKLLGVSTRTVDRYVKWGKIGYKKQANKVLLDVDDVQALKEEFSTGYEQQTTSELVSEKTSSTLSTGLTKTSRELESIIDEKIDKFFLVFQEKDQIIKEKDKVIYMLQQRVANLEGKISTMVALPDHNEQKQLATIEKSKLEEKIKQLSRTVRGEKTKNNMFLIVFIVVVLFAIFRYLSAIKWRLSF